MSVSDLGKEVARMKTRLLSLLLSASVLMAVYGGCLGLDTWADGHL